MKIFALFLLSVSVFLSGCDFKIPQRNGGLTKEQASTNVSTEVIRSKVIVLKESKKRAKKSRRYYLVAQDGSRLKVTRSEFDKAIVGKPWYSSEW